MQDVLWGLRGATFTILLVQFLALESLPVIQSNQINEEEATVDQITEEDTEGKASSPATGRSNPSSGLGEEDQQAPHQAAGARPISREVLQG